MLHASLFSEYIYSTTIDEVRFLDLSPEIADDKLLMK